MLFLNFAFWHEIFMFLLPRTGMAHLRSIFFFSEQRQEVYTNRNFLFVLGFQKKTKVGRRGVGDL